MKLFQLLTPSHRCCACLLEDACRWRRLRHRMGGQRPPIQQRRVPVKARALPALAGAAAAVLISAPALAADISGAGATFPYPIYAKWADAYKKETNIGLNYQSIGSGGGIKQ